MPQAWRSFRHRTFRIFFVACGISAVGTNLTRFAMVWMTYRLTHSGRILGLVGFLCVAPTALLAPLAGVLVDRWDRRTTIITFQLLAMGQVLALAVFAFTNTVTPWHLIALSTIQAVIEAFDYSARHSFVGDTVDGTDLPNAVALYITAYQGARLIGPLIAADLVARVGEGWCFSADAASYVIAVGLLVAIRVPRREVTTRHDGVLVELKEGWISIVRVPLLRSGLALLTASTLLGGAYTTLLPLVIGSELRGGPHALGILMGAGGLGTITGAAFFANSRAGSGIERILGKSAVGLGLAMSTLSFTTSTWMAAPFVFVIGACLMLQQTATITLVQMIVERDKRGRVLSLRLIGVLGGTAIGQLVEGVVADVIGPMHTLFCSGILILGCVEMYRRTLPKHA
jgi:MFS family permease